MILQGQCLPTMQSVTLPLELKAVPLLSLHSTTVPLSEVFAVEITVELNKPWFDPNSVMSWNVNGPHEVVKIGGLWSIVSEQSIGLLNIQRVIPVARLSWLHTNESWTPGHAVSTPPLWTGVVVNKVWTAKDFWRVQNPKNVIICMYVCVGNTP